MHLSKYGWIIVLLIAVASVSAEVELAINEASCKDTSGVRFLVTNRGSDEIGSSKLNIHANYFSSLGVGVDEKGIDKEFKIKVPGSWEDDLISISDGPIAFTSAQNVLTYPGEYKVTLAYEGCKSSYQKCEVTTRVTCPGVKEYGCESFSLAIDECKNTDDILTVRFHNFERGLLSDLDPYSDIKYVFYGNKQHLDNELPNTTVKEEGNDQYLLKMNLQGGNKIDRIKMEHKVCGHIVYANCKIEGSGVIRPLNNTSGVNRTVGTSSSEKKEQIISNEIIYIVAIIFAGTILFVVYQIRKK